MNVWIVPASSKKAIENVDKTLSAPISPSRLLNAGFEVEQDVFAWGAQNNASSSLVANHMAPGDICFFYTADRSTGIAGIHWAAVIKDVTKEADHVVSNAFWDTSGFPWYFLLYPPVKLSLTCDAFDAELIGSGAKPVSVRKLHRLFKDGDAFIDNKGGSVDWLDSLGVRFSSVTSDLSKSGAKKLSKYNLPESLSEDLIRIPSPRIGGGSDSFGGGYRGRSKQSKVVGDRGEEIVEEYIREKVHGAKKVLSVATDKSKPGRDIDYIDINGHSIMVEVKATTASSFVSIDMTSAEMEMAEAHREKYHLYLVTKCLDESPNIQREIDPYEKIVAGDWGRSTATWRIQFG